MPSGGQILPSPSIRIKPMRSHRRCAAGRLVGDKLDVL
jgi:hypothetical protein